MSSKDNQRGKRSSDGHDKSTNKANSNSNSRNEEHKKDKKVDRHARHNLSEIDDDFEEFESRDSIILSPENREPRDVYDRVTLWMDSWMDDDDGDFSNRLSDCERLKP